MSDAIPAVTGVGAVSPSSVPNLFAEKERGLEAALKKLIAGLNTRKNEYCQKINACAEHAQRQLKLVGERVSAGARVEEAIIDNVDILNFSGLPYTPPQMPDLPASPMNTTVGSGNGTFQNIKPALSPQGSMLVSPPSSSHQLLSPSSAYSSSPPHSPPPSSAYVTDVCVHHVKPKRNPPAGYQLVERTISGQHRANVNAKGSNNTKVFIGYKTDNIDHASAFPQTNTTGGPNGLAANGHRHTGTNSSSHVTGIDNESRPITSVSVFYKDLPEEPPLHFSAIELTTSGEDACLHKGATSHQPYLCVTRGEGAPLTHLGLISRAYKESLPSGWHEVKQTLFGEKADLNVQRAEGQSLYLCFRVDITPIMLKWKHEYLKLVHTTPPSTEPLLLTYTRLFALLSALFYSYDQKLILFTFDVFRKLEHQHIPTTLMNLFITTLADASPLFLTYFGSTTHSALLKFLSHLFRQCLPVLTLNSTMKIVDVCFLLRHEDKQNEISEHMIGAVLEGLATHIKPCICQTTHMTTGGGEAEDGAKTDSGANTPAVPISPSSTTFSHSFHFSSFASPGISTCYHCIARELRESLAHSPVDYCRHLVHSLAGHVRRQEELNTDVRSYRRHVLPTAQFRADMAHLLNKLLAFDAEYEQEQAAIVGRKHRQRFSFAGTTRERGSGSNGSNATAIPGSAQLIKEETEEGLRKENEIALVAKEKESVTVNKPAQAQQQKQEQQQHGRTDTLTEIRRDAGGELDESGSRESGIADAVSATPSKLPSSNAETTMIVDSPVQDKEANGPLPNGQASGALLFSPGRHSRRRSSGRGSGSIFLEGDEDDLDGDDDVDDDGYNDTENDTAEFVLPEFHEESPPTPVREEDEADIRQEEAEEEDEEQPGALTDAAGQPPNPISTSTAAMAIPSNKTPSPSPPDLDSGDNSPVGCSRPLSTNEPPLQLTHSLSSSPDFNTDTDVVPMPMVSLFSPIETVTFEYPDDQFDRQREEKDRIRLLRKDEKVLLCLILMYSKQATEAAPFGLRDSETLRRKQHALRLLLHALQRSATFFRASLSSSLLLRRFVFPALMTASVTDNMGIFRLILQLVSCLWEKYREEAMIELGAFIDLILLSFLENPLCHLTQKTAIIEVMLLSMFKSPTNVINTYYNYDNSAKNWPLFERLVEVLSKIVEGDINSDKDVTSPTNANLSSGRLSGSASSIAISNAGGGTGPTSSSGTSSAAAGEVDENGDLLQDSLQRQALKLLVHLLHMQAQWIGVPGLNRYADIPCPPLIQDPQAQQTDSSPLNVASDSSLASLTSPLGRSNPPRNSAHLAQRRPTWSSRYDQQRQQAKVLQDALKLAQTDSLKSALQYLRLTNPTAAQPMEMAKFLYLNNNLDKSQVGDLLSGTSDKFMRHEDYKALRTAYLSLLDFTGLSLDNALRSYLVDSGFRLPGESQKIDRLLEAFCEAYMRDNPNVFKNFDAALTLSFSLVMLNTDAHDPRLKGNSSTRKQMTVDEFARNLRGMNGGEDFPRTYLESLYRAIHAQEIKWEYAQKPGSVTDKPSKPKRSATGGSTNSSMGFDAGLDEQRLQTRKSYEVPVRKCLAYCKNHVTSIHSYFSTVDPMIVKGMYETTWYRSITALAIRSDHAGADVEVMHICLDGMAYGATIGVMLGMPTERKAFTAQLAKIIFIERNRDTAKRLDIHNRLAGDEHLKQDWYRPLNLQSEKHPAQACTTIFTQLNLVKQTINHERAQATLKRIENDFGGEIVLVDANRVLVKEGKLIKVNSTGTKRVPYHFMLFNDLILYASAGGMNNKYKVHRVVHLSLCRLEDVRSQVFPHAFRIVSPQKSFLVLAETAEKKKRWLDSILHQLTQVMEKRRKYIHASKDGEPQRQQVAPPPVSDQQHHLNMLSPPPLLQSISMLTPQQQNVYQTAGSASAGSSPVSPTKRDLLRISSSMDFTTKPNNNNTSTSTSASTSIPATTLPTPTGALTPTLSHPTSSPAALSTHHPALHITGSNGLAVPGAGHSSVTSPSDQQQHVLRRYSTFIGQSDLDLNSNSRQGEGVHRAATRCKLCIRPFNIFRRKQTCKNCGDIVCQDCCSRKAKLGGRINKVQQVCDACYGALIGMVGEDVQLLTIKEEGTNANASNPSNSSTSNLNSQNNNANNPSPGKNNNGGQKSAEQQRRDERRRTT